MRERPHEFASALLLIWEWYSVTYPAAVGGPHTSG
jgi:hypothetical protein